VRVDPVVIDCREPAMQHGRLRSTDQPRGRSASSQDARET